MDKMYNEYIYAFLFGGKNNSNFDDKTWHIKEETLDIFKQIIDDYPHTNFSDITDSFVKELKNNQNKLNIEIKNKYNMNY
jgi:outer membrane protein assembly factor BamD (BamD/ComL family)